MEKQKRDKLILMILLPIFVIGLLFRFAGKNKKQSSSRTQKPAVSVSYSSAESVESLSYVSAAGEQKDSDLISPGSAGGVVDQIKATIKNVKYNPVESADPLKNIFLEFLEDLRSGKAKKVDEKAKKQIKVPQMSIIGLVWNSDAPQAIINGRVVSVGDTIEGAKLVAVDKSGVKVEYEGYEFYIDKNANKEQARESTRREQMRRW